MSETLNREGWLAKAIELLRPVFDAAAYPLPEKVHVSVGFPSNRALSAKNQVVGQCWSKVSPDGMPHVFISPVLTDPGQVLGTLVHELVHAYGIHGHKKDFAEAGIAMGLTGKPTHMHAGPQLLERLNALVESDLGPYPHPSFDIVAMEKERKKQTTRLLKAECSEAPEGEDDTRYVLRVTKIHLDKHGAPYCPCHLKRMTVEGFTPEEKDDDS
jgi:hypothetical protein